VARPSSLVRWLALTITGAAAVAAMAAFAIGLVGVPSATGYFSPVFSPDGRFVYVLSREARATVTGFGATGFTPPATVRLHRDRFLLLRISVDEGSRTVVEDFGASPFEGDTLKAYHGAIFGSPHTHLRWADGEHLDYEIGVTRHDTPLARTFIIRRVWNARTGAWETTSGWTEASRSMSGDEPSQIHGDAEVIAVAGEEQMPCAIALLRKSEAVARALVQTDACRDRYPGGLTAATLAAMSRRADIERTELIRKTYADLAARGRRDGLSDSEALLRAGDEMSRLGLFPKRTKLVAQATACANEGVITVTDEEFQVGLFQDIERAIAAPGTEVDKAMGPYLTHRDYTTSKQVNARIDTGALDFTIRTRGACWRLTIVKP
jgi:hypothetical protein